MSWELIPKEELVQHPPKGGWKPQTWYLAEGAVATSNPVHEIIVFSGFLNCGEPCGYSFAIAANGGSDVGPVSRYKYLRIKKELHTYVT